MGSNFIAPHLNLDSPIIHIKNITSNYWNQQPCSQKVIVILEKEASKRKFGIKSFTRFEGPFVLDSKKMYFLLYFFKKIN